MVLIKLITVRFTGACLRCLKHEGSLKKVKLLPVSKINFLLTIGNNFLEVGIAQILSYYFEPRVFMQSFWNDNFSLRCLVRFN